MNAVQIPALPLEILPDCFHQPPQLWPFCAFVGISGHCRLALHGFRARPLIGRIKLPDLNRGHVRQVIEAVRDRGATVTVNRTLAALRRAFSWAVSKDLLLVNPALNMATDIQETSKDRALTVAEIRTLWTGLAEAAMGERAQIVLKIVLATGQRPGEVCGTRKDELDLA
jgi:integrase